MSRRRRVTSTDYREAAAIVRGVAEIVVTLGGQPLLRAVHAELRLAGQLLSGIVRTLDTAAGAVDDAEAGAVGDIEALLRPEEDPS